MQRQRVALKVLRRERAADPVATERFRREILLARSVTHPNACRILRPGGHLVFSCEAAGADEADWVLRKSLRYAHKRSHIEALCKAAGCNEITVEDTVLFVENQQPVHGYTVVARKKLARKAAVKKAAVAE